MRIEVNLFASLRRYLPEQAEGNSFSMQLEQGATVGQVLEKLNIPGEMPKIIFINGLIVKSEAILKDGDRAGIFPPVAGG